MAPGAAAQALDRLERGSNSNLLERHLTAIDRLVNAPLRTGNRARLLIDGPAATAAMFRSMEQARDNVNLEMYIIEGASQAGRRLADLLLRKRGEGVHVNLLYDSVGSLDTPADYFDRLRAAGVQVCEYNPVNPLRAGRGWRVNNRDHRKVLIVDGREAFTGGINISATYARSSSPHRGNRDPVQDGWRDTQIGARGPIVQDMQQLFLQTWAEQCGAAQPAGYFPRLTAQGAEIMRVIAGRPGESEIHLALVSAIDRAELSVHLTIGYFVPDPRTVQALVSAARRGVDVRLVLPGISDFWAPLYAGRSHYEELLGAGVRLYERRDALLHAKTAVIDGVWSTVGSTNVDWRSFVHNAEANMVVLGPDFGRAMEELFAEDVRESVAIDAARWSRRSFSERAKEWFARRWEYLL